MNAKKIVTFILLQLGAFGLFASLPAHSATPILTSIDVTPVNSTIALGSSLQYTATGTFSTGTSRQLIGGSGTWAGMASMPTPRSGLGLGVVNGTLYAVGGWRGFAVATVEAYDPATNTWTPRASMSTPRNEVGVGVVNGILYAMGGTGNDGYTISTMEAYDPVTNTWTPKASFGVGRKGMAMGVVNGILYAVGGQGDVNSSLCVLDAYNPATDTWTRKACIPGSRTLAAVGVVNGTLYAVGGYDFNAGGGHLSSMYAYNPVTDIWLPKASMPSARIALAVGVENGMLYAVGGSNNTNDLATVEAYNPATDTWSTMTSMPTPRSGLGVSVENGLLYAVGGYNVSGGPNLSDRLPATVGAFTPPDRFVWSSATTSVATIAQSGVAVGVGSGQTSITATSGSISGSTSLMVDTTAPSTPTGLKATVISKSQINLAWTASTDNVWVAGYKIERCAGSKCTNFVQVGTSTTTSFNNTGLAVRTTYRYRVRAYDTVGNNSAYSSIVNATTLR